MPDYEALLNRGSELREQAAGRGVVPVNGSRNPVQTIGRNLAIALQTGQPYAQITDESQRAKFVQFQEAIKPIAATVPEDRRAEFYDTLLSLADSEGDDGTPEGAMRLAAQLASQMGGGTGPDTEGLPAGYMWNEDRTQAVQIPGVQVKGVNINGQLRNPYTGAVIGPATVGAVAPTFEGTSLKGQAWNIILNANRNPTPGVFDSHDYSVAWQIVNEPDVKEIQNPDGTISLARVPPQIPPNLRRPGQSVLAAGGADVTAQPDAVTPIAGTERPREFNLNQSQAASYANRAQAAIGTLDQLEATGYNPANIGDQALGEVPIIGNLLTSSEYQQYQQAQRDFVTAVLRRESGAAISVTEFETEEQKYFPQVGDNLEVIDQKRVARQRALENLIAESGGAYQQLFGQSSDQPAQPQTQAEYDALPSGTLFRDPDSGEVLEKP